MISKKLILFKQYFLYEGKKYTIDEFFNNINEIYKNLEIIIAEDEIFISQYKLKDNNVTLFLDNIMLNNQINNENILTDYYFRQFRQKPSQAYLSDDHMEYTCPSTLASSL